MEYRTLHSYVDTAPRISAKNVLTISSAVCVCVCSGEMKKGGMMTVDKKNGRQKAIKIGSPLQSGNKNILSKRNKSIFPENNVWQISPPPTPPSAYVQFTIHKRLCIRAFAWMRGAR